MLDNVPYKITAPSTATRNFKENLNRRDSLFEWVLAKYFNLYWPKYTISGFEHIRFITNGLVVEINIVSEPYHLIRKQS
jgi:hypothetical protein